MVEAVKNPATPTNEAALASTAPLAAPPSPNVTMAFGWRRRQPQPSDQDAASEKGPEVQRVRKRDLLRQLFSPAHAEKKQERAASIPSVVEPEVCLARAPHRTVANMSAVLQRRSLLEPFRGLKKHYRSRSSFAKTTDDDRSAAAASTSDVPTAQPAQTDDADDARSEAPDDVSSPDPSGT
ncbi:hypothetical protein SLS55_004208 [Diplodia seriata]|uniref:Uncharacterized protein n=1 Tax=Diplodia seriata TaxID=420778 RepID=A0ABR3CIQ4_9PEZI